VQGLVRKEVMTQEEAIRALRLTYSQPPPKPLTKFTVPPLPELRLGELLVLSDVVSRDDIKMALEVAQTNNRRLGEILSIFAVLPSSTLSAALELQTMLQRGEVTIDEAITTLTLAYNQGMPISSALKNQRGNKPSSGPKTLSVASFLKEVGVLSENDIDNVIDRTLDNSVLLGQVLGNANSPDPFTMRTASRLKYLVQTSTLTLDAASFVFHHCVREHVDVDTFLQSSGWYQPVEPGSSIYASHTGHLVVV
jgi:hypothetical protein